MSTSKGLKYERTWICTQHPLSYCSTKKTQELHLPMSVLGLLSSYVRGLLQTFLDQYKLYCNQSNYREVPQWEIFMEQELRFGLDLGQFGNF